jgi:diacylglycerol O-acyltransferase / trehalose O-mycolyltransferase
VNARACLALLAALFVAGCGGQRSEPPPAPAAKVIEEERVGPRVIDLEIRSPALRDTAKVRLLTPRGWARDARRRWPVLYLLHGCCDSYVSWTRSTRVEEMPQLHRVLVVMPSGGAVGFYSDWLGSEGRRGPAWETFHLRELRGILERRYGAGGPWAIAGLSMGGHGAMTYAARHPGMFRAAASFSGVLNPLADAGFLMGLFRAFAVDPEAIWGDPRSDRRVWAAHDPTELAERLRGTRLFVSSGDGRAGPLDPRDASPDRIEPVVGRESRAFVRRLRDERIPVRADFYGSGTHTWPYFERELRRALPTLLGQG